MQFNSGAYLWAQVVLHKVDIFAMKIASIWDLSFCAHLPTYLPTQRQSFHWKSSIEAKNFSIHETNLAKTRTAKMHYFCVPSTNCKAAQYNLQTKQVHTEHKYIEKQTSHIPSIRQDAHSIKISYHWQTEV